MGGAMQPSIVGEGCMSLSNIETGLVTLGLTVLVRNVRLDRGIHTVRMPSKSSG